jgi:septal ring-binding cell division protein DamX
VTEHDQREHYNLFFGVFDTVTQARAAIAALPAELRANRPWVRQFQSRRKAAGFLALQGSLFVAR